MILTVFSFIERKRNRQVALQYFSIWGALERDKETNQKQIGKNKQQQPNNPQTTKPPITYTICYE